MFQYFDPLTHRTFKFNPNHDDTGRFASTTTDESLGSKDPKIVAYNQSSIASSLNNSRTGQESDKTAKNLLSLGYKEVTTAKNSKNGRFFSREEGDEFGANSPGFVHHFIQVNPNGSWTHFSEGHHSGKGAEDVAQLSGELPKGADYFPSSKPFMPQPHNFRIDDVMKPYEPQPTVTAPARPAPFRIDDVMKPFVPPERPQFKAPAHNFRIDDVMFGDK